MFHRILAPREVTRPTIKDCGAAGRVTPRGVIRVLAALLLIPFLSFAEDETASTNVFSLTSEDYIESVSFILADEIKAEGRAYDDVFWAATNAILDGRFDNDVWLLAKQAKLGGSFADHVRVIGQSIQVDGVISNGLWAVGAAITTTTNSSLFSDQLFYGDNITLLGEIEGNIFAKGRRITLGGTIVGNVSAQGDEIIVRPGTTIVGNFIYATTNQTIVLDAASNVSGITKHVEIIASSGWSFTFRLYLLGAAILVGIPYMLLFPGPIGLAVRSLRANMIKCGIAGLLFMILIPVLMVLAAVSVLGFPLALVLGAIYGLVLYLGQFSAALTIGSAVLGRRGQISTTGALLSLVVGLFVFYSIAVIPYIGGSLQTVAIAFGAGSLVLTILAGRGRAKQKSNSKTEQS